MGSLRKESSAEELKAEVKNVEVEMQTKLEKSSPVEEEMETELEKSSPVEVEMKTESKKSSSVEEEINTELEKSSPVEEEMETELEKSSPIEVEMKTELEKSSSFEEEMETKLEKSSPVEIEMKIQSEKNSSVEAETETDLEKSFPVHEVEMEIPPLDVKDYEEMGLIIDLGELGDFEYAGIDFNAMFADFFPENEEVVPEIIPCVHDEGKTIDLPVVLSSTDLPSMELKELDENSSS